MQKVSVPSRKYQNSKKHFRLYTVLTDYLKTILIRKNQQSLHSRRGLEIHILPAPPLEPQQETQITNWYHKIHKSTVQPASFQINNCYNL